MEIVPLEVKAERNVKSQSLKSYLKRYRPKLAFRASMLPHIKQNIPLEGEGVCRFCNVPLYAMGQFEKIVGSDLAGVDGIADFKNQAPGPDRTRGWRDAESGLALKRKRVVG